MGLSYFQEPYDMSKEFTVSDLGEELFIGGAWGSVVVKALRY